MEHEIDQAVNATSLATLRRSRAIEQSSGLLRVRTKERDFSSDEARNVARNFFYLSLTRALSEGMELRPGTDLQAVEAGIYFLYKHVMHVDAVVDQSAHQLLPDGAAYLVMGLDQIGLGIGDASRFQEVRGLIFEKLRDTIATVDAESFDGDVPALGYDGYAAIARQKCCMADIVPTALMMMTAAMDDDRCRTVQAALGHIHVAMQWIDDLADLAKDRARRQPSHLWSRLSIWAAQEGIALAASDDTRFRQVAYVSGLATLSLKEAIDEFRAALACLAPLHLEMLPRTLVSMIRAQEGNLALIQKLLEDAQGKASQGRAAA